MNRALLVTMMFAGFAGTAAAQLQFQTPSPLPSGIVGQQYGAAAQTNAQVAVHCTLGGVLPAGLALSDSGSACAINGVPSQSSPQPFVFQLTATAPGQGTGSQQYALTINPSSQGFVITTTTLPDGVLNQTYNASVQTAGSAGGLSSEGGCGLGGNFPPGLSMTVSQTSCLISGTPTATGFYTFQVTARDLQGNTTPTVNLSINVTTTGGGGNLQITTTFVNSGVVNNNYQFQFQASGGSGSYIWGVVGGSLPPGLSLAQSGFLSGVPQQAGGYSFTVQVTSPGAVGSQSVSGTFTMSVSGSGGGLQITTSSIPSGVVNTSYLPNGTTFFFTASGGTTSYSWGVSSGGVPSGLFLNSNGSLTGTPQQVGSYTFTVRVTSGSQFVDQTFTMTINSSGGGNLQITTSGIPSGVVNTSYFPNGNTFFFNATGGTGAYSWTVVNNFPPPGLSLNSNGSLNGTPQQAGSYTFTVRVTSGSQFVDQTFTMTINSSGGGNLQITTSGIPSGVLNTAYFPNGTTFLFTATGGTGSYSWGVVNGALPPGIFLNSSGSGSLTGTPQQVGTYQFTIRVTSGSLFVDQGFSMIINSSGSGFQITTSSVPSAVINTQYLPVGSTFQFQTNGGTGSYAWSLFSGSLPPGLFLGPSNGTLTGIPTQAGNFPFGIQVTLTGPGTTTATAQQSFNMTVNSGGGLQIITTSIPNGVVGNPYLNNGSTFFFQATGGSGSYTWQVVNSSLPSGLVLNQFGNGSLTGTPQQAGTFTFSVQAFDSQTGAQSQSRSFQTIISGSGGGFQITTSSIPNGVLNTSYFFQFGASGGTGSYSWQLVNGALPPGLFLNSNGSLNGTPTQTGSYTFTVQVSSGSQSLSQTFTMTIDSTGGGGLQITTTAIPGAVVGAQYFPNGTTFQFQATGGFGSYFWTASNGFLPPGLILGQNDGTLTGVPTQVGTYGFDIQVTSSSLFASRHFTMTVSTGQLRIIESTLPFAVAGQAYSTTLHADGGAPSYQWSLGSTALAGLSIDTFSGVLSGTPTTQGTYSVPITVRDAAGTSVTFTFSLFVAAPLGVLTTSLPDSLPGATYNFTLQAGGGQSPYTWSIDSGSLPPGVTLNASNGVLSGVPTAQGRFTFTVRVRDAGSRSATKDLSILVGTPVSVTTSSLPDGAVGVSYPQQTLAASGGVGPYTWTVSGTLPGGLTLSDAGVISGTPTTTGTFSFTVTAKDSQGSTAQKTLSINIVNPVVITTGTIVDGTRGVAYSQAFGASGGTTPYTWSVSGVLPTGLSLDTSSGLLSGVPTNSGSFGFTVQVKDVPGQTASKSFLLNINEPLSITTSSLSVSFGSAVSVSLVAAGGFAPYTWDITNGSLPAGLSLSSAGLLSGTPTVAGTSTVTVRVSDSKGSQPVQKQISITVNLPALPAVTVRIVNANGSQPGPAQQPPLNLTLGASTFPSDVTGTLTLTFTPGSGTDPNEAKFSNGSRTLNFTVLRGTTTATFPSVGNAAVLTGTVAGTITITATALSAAGTPLDLAQVPVQRITIDPAPPVITGVQLQQVSGAVNVIVTGYSTPREVTGGTFRFAAATGSTLQTSDFTVALTAAFTAWYSSAQSNATGSQFTLTVPFSTTGTATSIVSVSVTLTNSRGNSNTATP